MKDFLSLHWISWQTIVATLGITGILFYLIHKTRVLIRQNSRRIIDAFFRIISRIVTRSLRARLSMRQYCANQLSDESTYYLYVPGFRGASLDVDEVFVPLALNLGGRDLSFSSNTFLEAGSRLLIVGDPGCGKSTLLKQAFREACRDTHDKPSKGQLPIRLELKRFSPPANLVDDRSAGEWFFERVRDTVVQVEGFEIAELFDAWVADTGLLVLLDGLDEVASDNYSLMAASLRGLSRILAGLSSKNQIIVSMRIQFHQRIRSDLIDDYPQSLYVRPFTPNEIYTFLNQWPFEEDSEKYIKEIYQTLADRPTLRDMCSNPLILAMYVVNHYESSAGDVPDTRTQFYEKVISELLFRRRKRQEVTTGRFVGLRDQREAILGELAFQNLIDSSQPANSLSRRTAIRVAARILKCSISDAELRVRELAEETGLIADERAETIHFIHLTFCEFLAAVECARGRRNGWATLLSVHRDFLASNELQLQSRLVEVLPFAHALLPRVDRSAVLADMATLADRLVLGRCFLETQLYGEPEWAIYLADERGFLADEGKKGWDDTLLRRLHLFSVVVRDARDWHRQVARTSADELENVFAVIVGGSRQAVVQIFVTYASQDAAAAIRLADDIGVDIAVEYPELAIESCQQETFLALALEKATSGHGEVWTSIVTESALRYKNIPFQLIGKYMEPFTGQRKADWKLVRALYEVPIENVYGGLLRHVLAGNTAMPAIDALRIFVRNSSRIYWIQKIKWPLRAVTIISSLSGLGYLAFLIFGGPHRFHLAPALTIGIVVFFLLLAFAVINVLVGMASSACWTVLNFFSSTPDSGWKLVMFKKFFQSQWRALQDLDAIRSD